MELDGSLTNNLKAAIASATRLRGHPVHSDTLEFWRELLTYARGVVRRSRVQDITQIGQLIADLEVCLAEHQRTN